jgi:hypothetical protein
MTSAAVATRGDYDVTDLPWVIRAGVRLGILEAVLVLLYSLADRFLPGPLELVVCAAVLVAGIAAVTLLPGIWTRARTIEGIAGAAGIGLMATVIFLLIDVSLLQPFGIYTNRWRAIGGGANWWYHPVWWMVGTYLTWMGAFVLANQAARSGSPSPVALVLGTIVLALVCLAVAVVIGVPRAGWNLGSFSVAVLPALALMTLVTSIGVPRR